MCHDVSPIPDDILMNLVVNFVDVNGNWRWKTFELLLPSSIILRIAAVHPPIEGKDDDQIFWANSKKGEFSVSTV